MILVVDNYDSFTYNLVQYLRETAMGVPVEVFRNDVLTAPEVEAMNPSHIVISPGPGRPDEARLSNDIIRTLASKVPILGVCLGHQCLAWCYGAAVIASPDPTHGKTSRVHHTMTGLFRGVPTPFAATRYHSLIVDPVSVREPLEVTAWTDTGAIMGLRIRGTKAQGVQFHPESILSEHGKQLIRNFLDG